MRARVIGCLLAASLLGTHAWAEGGGNSLAPSYSAASIVNSATNLTDSLAPNTIVTIYGENLSYHERGLVASDISGGSLPNVLPGTGVRIFLNNIPAHIYYVSPRQINFLTPNDLVPGEFRLQLVRDGLAGPKVNVRLREAAPALYQWAPETAIAIKADGSLSTEDSPAHPGEVVVLYATGLGPTAPSFPRGMIPTSAAEIARRSEFLILLDRSPVPSANIAYVGVAPGFAGLYQINLWLPNRVGDDPEIELLLAGEISRPGIRIPVRK